MKIPHGLVLVAIAVCATVWLGYSLCSDCVPAGAPDGDDGQVQRRLGQSDGHGHGGSLTDSALREQRSPVPNLVVEVWLPGKRAPAVGAAVHVAGPGSQQPIDQQNTPPVELVGQSCGCTDTGGRLTIPAPGVRRISARLGAMYTEQDVHDASGVVTIVLDDVFSPWVQVVDGGGEPVDGVDVDVVAGTAEVIATERTDDKGLVRLHAIWPRGDDRPRGLRVLLPGRACFKRLVRDGGQFPIVMSLGSVARLSVGMRPRGVSATVSVAAVDSSESSKAIGPTRLLRKVASAEVVVPAGGFAFAVRGWRDDGRAVAAPLVEEVVAGEVRDVVLDFRGRLLRGKLVGVDVAADVFVYIRDGRVWRARPLRIGSDGAFECVLDPADARVVFATSGACSDAFTDLPEQGQADLGRVLLLPRPVLGTVVVHGAAGDIAPANLLVQRVQNANGQWVGFKLRSPLAFRAGPSGVEVLGLPGLIAARVAAQRAGCYAEPESVEVRDGRVVNCQLLEGAAVEVWLVDGQASGVRDFWLRDQAGKTYARASVRRTESGAWARFVGLRPGAYSLVVRDGEVVAPPVEVLTSDSYELHATMR